MFSFKKQSSFLHMFTCVFVLCDFDISYFYSWHRIFTLVVDIAKAPFDIPVKEPVTEIPPEVLKRCYGKQNAITPHCQRLIVAAAKEAKVEKGSKGKGKGKPKTEKGPPKAKAKAKAKGKPKEADPAVSSDPKQKSVYAQEKAKYVEELLVSN